MGILTAIFTTIGSILTGPLKDWSDRRKVKVESQAKIEEARVNAQITQIEKAAENDSNWETIWAQQADHSWRDEWFTILLSLPLIFAFVPGMTDIVQHGFDVLATTPIWYRYLVGCAVAAAFGLRGILAVMSKL